MNTLLIPAQRLFDRLHFRWESPHVQRRVGTVLVLSFLGSLLVIELNRQGLLPDPFAQTLSRNHFGAVAFTFTLLLIFEVVSLVFALSRSVAESVGKQFELLSLILLRKAFLEFGKFGEPLQWEQAAHSVLPVLSDIGGALLIFVVVGLYYRIQRHHPITRDEEEQANFVAAKKAVALLVLVTFVALGALSIAGYPHGRNVHEFFEVFFTVLIFTDVLIVLISLQYSTSFAVVFRNSGFAAATVVIRLALTAPAYVNALLGLAAVLLALGLSYAYNVFAPIMARQHGDMDPMRRVPAEPSLRSSL